MADIFAFRRWTMSDKINGIFLANLKGYPFIFRKTGLIQTTENNGNISSSLNYSETQRTRL